MPENPFDILAKFIDPEKTYDENCKSVLDAVDDGSIPKETVAQLLVSASVMPHMAVENVRLRGELDEACYETTNLKKALAIVQQEGQTIEDERNNIKRFYNTKGQVVN